MLVIYLCARLNLRGRLLRARNSVRRKAASFKSSYRNFQIDSDKRALVASNVPDCQQRPTNQNSE